MKKTGESIGIIIPSFNEEKRLAAAVSSINGAVKSTFDDYELIIVNDGSTDKTEEVAEQLARQNPKVKVIHNKKNMNIGYNYKVGLAVARKKYVMSLPGSDGIPAESIKGFLQHVGEKDIILAYVVNKEARSWSRRLVSTLFTTTLNILFGLKLKYYLGMACYETNLVRQAKITTNSYAFQAEVLVRLLKRGYSYREVPSVINAKGGSKMFRTKNILGVAATIPKLFIEVWFEVVSMNIKKLLGKGGS